MNNKRNTGIELARFVAMLFVLTIHTLQDVEQESLFRSILEIFLWSSNLIFFTISGQLNLSKPMNDAKDMGQFYLKRVVSIVLPLFLTTTMMYTVDVLKNGRKLSLGYFYGSFISSYANTHLWFIYTLIGLMVCAPLLAKGLQHMSDGELHLLFAVAMLFLVGEYYLTENLGLDFSFNSWLLEGYLFYFCAGYYLQRVLTPRRKHILYALGIVGFLATLASAWFFPEDYKVFLEDSPQYILFVLALYVFLSQDIPVKGRLESVVLFLGRHSLTIYLIHWTMLFEVVTPLVPDFESRFLFFFCRYTLNLALCIPIAAAFDRFLLFPLQRKLNKLIAARLKP